ncbi:MAG: phosphoribosylaminoimidazolesuccinocarboxamide synthase [bacterium]|nr:phosphoribosylaminoimidazolesuccinocarboxamide synthase [bacterium]
MDTATAHRLTAKYPLGELLTEGKTKKIHWSPNCDSDKVIVISKDDITAGDGAKHDIVPDKGKLANETTCNVFRLLKACGLPVAFEEQDSATSFVAPCCTMLPYEVNARRTAFGTYVESHPEVPKRHLFPKLITEFHLKTKDKKWNEHALACDDPLMAGQEMGMIRLFNQHKPLLGQGPFLVLDKGDVFSREQEWKLFPEMDRLVRRIFLMLEKAWQILGIELVDIKVEFGFDKNGTLLIADVIDNDSWRLIERGEHLDKELYRQGGVLTKVTENYRRVAMLSNRFGIPDQSIILWRGSEKDNVDTIVNIIRDNCVEFINLLDLVTCSVHKEPEKAIATLHRLVQKVPDSVVIAYVGRSNGAGPVLSAASTVPVITVPASVKDFPGDVWSSLRTPSNVPVMTVLEPANAILAAMQILSARNPQLYAYLRGEVEKRLVNSICI